MNKTEILLLMTYETPIIPLDKICQEYFGCSKGTAKQRAKAGTLPVVAFRLGLSQKLPWMVSAEDLAKFIEQQRSQAHQEWVGASNH